MGPETPNPPPIPTWALETLQQANLERWKLTRGPATWAWKHFRGWSNNDWLTLLAELRESQYSPMHEGAIGQHLEMLRAKLLAIVTEYEREGGKPGNNHVPVGRLLLRRAAKNGDTAQAEALLAAGVDVNAKSGSGTPLFVAVSRGHKHMVEFLLANHADANINDGNYWPLRAAFRNDRQDLAELLLANKADVNARDKDGWTLLHRAATERPSGMVESLLAAKADVDARNNDDETPLHVAVRCGGTAEIVELLLANKAAVNAKDKDGNTPLFHAVGRKGRKDIATLLRQHGGKIGFRKRLALTWEEFSEIMILILIALSVGGVVGPLLHWLAHSFPIWGGSVLGVVAALCAEFCVIVVSDKGDEGLAIYALRLLSGWAMFAIGIAVLLHSQSPWFPTWAAAATFGVLAAPILCPLALLLPVPKAILSKELFKAASSYVADEVKKLIDAGAEVDARSNDGTTALMFSAKANEYTGLDKVKALIAAGADVNARNNDGATALMFSAEQGHVKKVEALIAAGADVNAKDKSGETALKKCRGNPAITAALKAAEEKADSNVASASKVTAGRSDARPRSAPPNSGPNWYFAEDKARCLRQVVLISDPRRAVKSRFSALALPGSFIELVRNPLVTGLFPMSGYQENFLLVRTDRMAEEVAKSSLQISFSFFHLPTSGLVAIHVSCVPLKANAKRGWLEQIYGLDSDLTRGLVENAVKGEGLHVIHAGEGGMRTKVVIVGGEKTGDMEGPLCKFDVDIPYENDCRSVLAEEWNALLRHHRSIRNPDFQAAGKRLYELMPEGVNPIRPRFPFEQFEHAMIFVKGPATNLQLSDDVHLVLEEMTGRTIREVSLKARPMHMVKNSGGVVDDVAKGTSQGLIAATELGLKLRDKELPMRFVNDSLRVVERYFRDPESGAEMAIFLFYGV